MFAQLLSVFSLCASHPLFWWKQTTILNPPNYLSETPGVSWAKFVQRGDICYQTSYTWESQMSFWVQRLKFKGSHFGFRPENLLAFVKACLFLFACPNYITWLHNKYYASILSLSCFYLQTMVAVALLMKQLILKDCLPQRDLSLKWLHFIFQTQDLQCWCWNEELHF